MDELRRQLNAALAENEQLSRRNAELVGENRTLIQQNNRLFNQIGELNQTIRDSAAQTNAKLDRLFDAHKESTASLKEHIRSLKTALLTNTRKRTIDPRPDSKVHGIAVLRLTNPDDPNQQIIRCVAGQRHYVKRQISRFIPREEDRTPEENLLLDFTETANPIDARNNFVRRGAAIQRQVSYVIASFIHTYSSVIF
jgi:regulator of replication initiation timing